MPTPNSKFKIRGKASPASYRFSKNNSKRKNAFSKSKQNKYARRTMNADIVVKRSNYSKAVRAAVLVDAAARQRLIEMGGENTIDVIREFNKDMSDDELAKKTGIKPSEVRVVLNRLHNKGVFAYTRVRDKDSGWYSYIWKMDEKRLREIGSVNMRGEITQTRGKEGYRCSNCDPQKIVDFPDAVDIRFRCDSCGNCLEYVDSRRSKMGSL